MNILRTFELFWRLPVKLFSNRQVKVVHIETNLKAQSDILTNAEVSDSDILFTVYNNKKVYNLLSSVLYKKKMINENKERKIFN